MRRRLWVSQRGWPSTAKILDLVKLISCKNSHSRELWTSWVFDQAQEIVNSQKPPRGRQDLYVNASKVTHSLFERTEESEHEDLKKFTPFIYNLIHSKLEYSHKARCFLRESKIKKKMIVRERKTEEGQRKRLKRENIRMSKARTVDNMNIFDDDDDSGARSEGTDASDTDSESSDNDSKASLIDLSDPESCTDNDPSQEDEEPTLGYQTMYCKSKDKNKNIQQRNRSIASAATNMVVFGCNC